jgi:multidrug resistance efflux pump
MTTEPASPDDKTTAGNTAGSVPGHVVGALRDALAQSRARSDFYRRALRVLAGHFDAQYAAMHLEDSAQSIEDEVIHGATAGDDVACNDGATTNNPARHWKPHCDALLLDSRYHHLATARLYDTPVPGSIVAVMAVPITEDNAETIGSLAVVTACSGKSDAAARLAELESYVQLMVSQAAAIRPAREPSAASPAHASLAKAAAYQDLNSLAFALANGLKSRFGCEQVSVGLVRGPHVQLLCVSGLDDLYPRSPGFRWIRQAMEECVDAGRPVCCQRESDVENETIDTGHLLHLRWHHQTSGASVACIPLMHDGRVAAVVAVRRRREHHFQHEELQSIASLAGPLVPGLLLLEKAGRSLVRHAADTSHEIWNVWTQPGAWGRKAALATVVATALWMVFGKMELIVTVPCEVVPREITQIAAPLEGMICNAYVEPGDRVSAGQVLVELDVRELNLERNRLLAEQRVTQLEMSEALEARDRAAAAQAHSRMDIAQANLELVLHRLAHAAIRAPANGIILKGEPRKRVGEVVPLGEPLLDFAPQGNWSVEVHAPEFSAVYLQTGQTGQFTTTARPDQPQNCKLSRIELASEVVEGRNVFVAQADMDGSPDWLRGGMTGVARIQAGRRPVWWVALHRLIDSFRLLLWKL